MSIRRIFAWLYPVSVPKLAGQATATRPAFVYRF